MKKLLLSTVAFVSVTAGAMAADLPRRQMAPILAPVPLFTWTGFYVGVNAGYGFNANDDDNGLFGLGNQYAVPVPPVGALQTITIPGVSGVGTFGGNGDSNDGFVGGAQVGFNYQFTPGSGFVVGIEADIQWADFNGSNNDGFGFFGFAPGAGPFGNAYTAVPTVNATGLGVAAPTAGSFGNVVLFNNAFGNNTFGNRGNDSDWFGTVRGRVGYAFDRVLVYGTAGIAFRDSGGDDNFPFFFGGNSNAVALPFFVTPAAAVAGSTVVPNSNAFLFSGNRSSNDTGWTVGGGVEWALPVNWFGSSAVTFKIEGLYVNFDEDNNDGFFGGGNNVVGVTNQGAPVVRNDLALFGLGDNRRDQGEFWVVRAGLNFKFGTF